MDKKRFFDRLGYKVLKKSSLPIKCEEDILRISLASVICYHLLGKDKLEDFFFIQVGAFDGVSFDPIYPFVQRFGWSGILLEPQKDAFSQLCENYREQPQLSILNMAISDDITPKNIYRVRDNDVLPDWTYGIASFDRDTIVKHQFEDFSISDFLVEELVSCTTFNKLLDESSVNHIDLLQIDAEGYDFEIVKMFDFERLKPSIISYEQKHIPMQRQRELTGYLASYGYKVFANGHDTVAYLGPMDRLPWEAKQ